MTDTTPGRPGRRRWSAGALMGLLVCLGLVAVLNFAVPRFDPSVSVAEVAGRDEWVSMPGYRARLLDTVVATRIGNGNHELTSSSGTVWLVVTWQIAADHDEVRFGRISAVTDEVRYLRRMEFGASHHASTPAGFSHTCTEIFQVPRDRLAGAHMELAPSRASGLVVLSRSVEFDLALGPDEPVVEHHQLAPCELTVAR